MCEMLDEMESLKKNNRCELVQLPREKRVISCKWVFKRKPIVAEKEWGKFKVCLVENGYSQHNGIDYDDIFSLIVKHTSIRAVK